MTPAELGLLSAITFVAFTIHSVTGFASMITALVIGSWFFELSTIRPPLVAISVVLNLYFVVRYRADLSRRILLGYVLPWMGGGAVLGFLVSGAVQGPMLRRAFGVFVVVVAGRELVRAWRASRGGVGEAPLAESPPLGWLVASGVIHGIYATGGPPLVFALSRVRLDKSALRATLCAVWLVLNGGLTVGYVVRDEIDTAGWIAAASMLPGMLAAVWFGSRIHDRIDPARFRVAVYVVLLGAALGLVFR